MQLFERPKVRRRRTLAHSQQSLGKQVRRVRRGAIRVLATQDNHLGRNKRRQGHNHNRHTRNIRVVRKVTKFFRHIRRGVPSGQDTAVVRRCEKGLQRQLINRLYLRRQLRLIAQLGRNRVSITVLEDVNERDGQVNLARDLLFSRAPDLPFLLIGPCLYQRMFDRVSLLINFENNRFTSINFF